MELQFVGQVATGQGALDHGIAGLEVVTTAMGTFVLSTSGAGGGLVSFRLGTQGPAQIVDTQTFPTSLDGTASQMVDALALGGGLQVAIGSGPGGALVGYGLSQTGQIGGTVTALQLSGVGQAVDCAGVETGGGTVIYVVDGVDGSLSAHGPVQGTIWQSGGNTPDFDRVETIEAGGSAVVLATGAGMDGVVSYAVNAATGALSRVDSVGMADGMGIGIPTDMVTVSAHNQQFVVLAAAGTGSLTVMRVGAHGGLEATDHLIDTLHTRFGGVQAVQAVAVDGQVFVVAGGGDDGLSLFSLLPDGRLVHLQSLPHDTGTGLMNVSEIAVAQVGDSLQILVGSQNAGGVAQFSLSLADMGDVIMDSGVSVTLQGGSADDLLMSWAGNDTLRGGAGDDILVAGAGNTQMWGGAGADTFVLRDGGHAVAIHDFQAGTDRLDMGDYFFLRGVDQLQINSTAWGARIIFGDDRIDVRSMGGGSLDAADIFGLFGLTGPDHLMPFDATLAPDTPSTPDTVISEPVPPAPTPPPTPAPTPNPDGPATPSFDAGAVQSPFGLWVPAATGTAPSFWGIAGLSITGTSGADLRYGSADNDSLSLRDGNDTAWAGAGHDYVDGGGGADTLGGGDGNDTLNGGDGGDLLGGGAGHDRLLGGLGDDALWGGYGRDTLFGGWNSDTLGGGGGDDTLLGGGGNDEMWGGFGDDRFEGGDGADTAGGFWGDDTLLGGAGGDELWGAGGDDMLWGETGNDRLGAGPGDDTVSGGGGSDMLFGGAGHDVLNGGGGADQIFAAWGNDTIAGEAGHDVVYGGAGRDVIWGGGGDDIVSGGTGNDTLTGGAGRDTFVFGSNHGTDLVRDFALGEDLIQLYGVSSFDQLDLVATSDGNTLVIAGATHIFLDDIAPGSLGADDFLFG